MSDRPEKMSYREQLHLQRKAKVQAVKSAIESEWANRLKARPELGPLPRSGWSVASGWNGFDFTERVVVRVEGVGYGCQFMHTWTLSKAKPESAPKICDMIEKQLSALKAQDEADQAQGRYERAKLARLQALDVRFGYAPRSSSYLAEDWLRGVESDYPDKLSVKLNLPSQAMLELLDWAVSRGFLKRGPVGEIKP